MQVLGQYFFAIVTGIELGDRYVPHFAKSEVHISLFADNCVDLWFIIMSLFLFEISTNKGDSVKFLAKFGKI